jgi:hypothetical protein
MAYLILTGEVPDFDTWKQDVFDADPVGRKQAGGKAHRLYRGVENPNEVIIQGEFSTAEQATAYRERLLSSGVVDRAGAKLAGLPIVVEKAETVTY